MRLDHSEPQEPPHQRFGAGGVLLNPISAEVGHPFTCAEACKYVKRKGVRGVISLTNIGLSILMQSITWRMPTFAANFWGFTLFSTGVLDLGP